MLWDINVDSESDTCTTDQKDESWNRERRNIQIREAILHDKALAVDMIPHLGLERK